MSKELGICFVGRNYVFRIWLDVVAPTRVIGNTLRDHAQRVWNRKMGLQYVRREEDGS